jgi:hypothetical protein
MRAVRPQAGSPRQAVGGNLGLSGLSAKARRAGVSRDPEGRFSGMDAMFFSAKRWVWEVDEK